MIILLVFSCAVALLELMVPNKEGEGAHGRGREGPSDREWHWDEEGEQRRSWWPIRGRHGQRGRQRGGSVGVSEEGMGVEAGAAAGAEGEQEAQGAEDVEMKREVELLGAMVIDEDGVKEGGQQQDRSWAGRWFGWVAQGWQRSVEGAQQGEGDREQRQPEEEQEQEQQPQGSRQRRQKQQQARLRGEGD